MSYVAIRIRELDLDKRTLRTSEGHELFYPEHLAVELIHAFVDEAAVRLVVVAEGVMAVENIARATCPFCRSQKCQSGRDAAGKAECWLRAFQHADRERREAWAEIEQARFKRIVEGESLRRERDEARAQRDAAIGELARLRAWATGERGEPSL